MNFIEFKKDNNLSAEIHYNKKLRIIKNEANIKKLLDICQKYGYEKLDRHYYNKKKNNIKIYNIINKLMKLKKDNSHLKGIMVAGTLIALTAISPNKNNLEPTITNEATITDENNDEQINITKENLNTIKKEDIKIADEESSTEDEITNMLKSDLPEFVFDYANENTTNLENAKRYTDLFEKYGKMYGIDPSLLMAISAQESGGMHYDFLYNYPAVGLMQIEKAAFVNQEIVAYNHIEEREEKFLITENNLTDLDTNIKVGAMLLQIALEANDYNIPLGIQTYNFGTNYINKCLKMCESISGTPVSAMKNDMNKTEWRYYREFLNIGDPYYVEHVLSFISDKNEITVKNRANQDITLKITNTAQKTKAI